MTRLIILTLWYLITLLVKADDELWKDNKLTPAQPFPGRVLAVESGWGGYRLVIESGGEGEKRYCIARVWPGVTRQAVEYQEVRKQDLPTPGVMMVFLDPAVEVSQFSWSMGPRKIGRIFGAEDCLLKAVKEVLIDQ
ncbi:MAG: hypothetical protein V4819_14015 [Verrucomicrobiota bacterium]